MFTYYSQRDPKWSSDKLGLSSCTVGKYGCLETSLCSFSSYCGVTVTPDQVALHQSSFNKDGEYLWNYPEFPFLLDKSIKGRNDIEILKSLKDPKRGVVLQVDNGAHFVLALSKNLFGSYWTMDPWFGKRLDAVKQWKNITGSRHLLMK